MQMHAWCVVARLQLEIPMSRTFISYYVCWSNRMFGFGQSRQISPYCSIVAFSLFFPFYRRYSFYPKKIINVFLCMHAMYAVKCRECRGKMKTARYTNPTNSSAMAERACDAFSLSFTINVQLYLQNHKIAFLSHHLGQYKHFIWKI